MGYFNDLADGCFKTSRDGKTLFYPWGWLGRGYVVPSAKISERLRRQMRVWMKVVFPLMLLTLTSVGTIAANLTGSSSTGAIVVIVSGLLVLATFTVWVNRRCRDLKETNEVLIPPV